MLSRNAIFEMRRSETLIQSSLLYFTSLHTSRAQKISWSRIGLIIDLITFIGLNLQPQMLEEMRMFIFFKI